MTVLNWSASIFFRQRFPIKIYFAMLIYLQHATFILQNILKRKSKLTGSWGSKTKGFRLSFKNSSSSDRFLNFFEPSCTPSEVSGQATEIFLLLFFISVAFAIGDAITDVLLKFEEGAVQIISNLWFSDCLLFESPCHLLNCVGKVFTTLLP